MCVSTGSGRWDAGCAAWRCRLAGCGKKQNPPAPQAWRQALIQWASPLARSWCQRIFVVSFRLGLNRRFDICQPGRKQGITAVAMAMKRNIANAKGLRCSPLRGPAPCGATNPPSTCKQMFAKASNALAWCRRRRRLDRRRCGQCPWAMPSMARGLALVTMPRWYLSRYGTLSDAFDRGFTAARATMEAGLGNR